MNSLTDKKFITSVFQNGNWLYLLTIIATVAFFYIPFSRALELIIVILFFIEIIYWLINCLKKEKNNRSLTFFFTHFLTIVMILYFAPQKGRNKEIDTSKWGEYTLGAILQDISNQTGFFVSIKGIPITSEKITEDLLLQKILEEKINWDKQKITAEEAVYFLTKESDLQFMIKENKQEFLWASMSGSWTSFSIPIYQKNDYSDYSKPIRLIGWL